MIFKNILLNWIILLFITVSVAISYVALMGLLSETVRREHQGTLMGTTLMLMSLAWTLTGFGTKFLFGFFPDLPFILSILSFALGIILLPKKQDAP